MKYDIDILTNNMEILFDKVLLEEKKIGLKTTKDDFKKKEMIISDYINEYRNKTLGKFLHEFNSELLVIKNEFNSLYENFDDKLMLFIVGDGNVGKSTLINTLIGKKVAETNVVPTTWKIDVYYPSSKDEALIRFNNGVTIKMTVTETKKVVEEEERKAKEAKKIFNKMKREAVVSLKTKEERQEMEKKLASEYLYRSNIVEVRWPVKSNWILEQCLLVDTPGLNQDLLDSNQLGSIQDYYHKADGVLWLVDGQSVSSQSNNEKIMELNNILSKVGGIRGNILGVINRIDLVRKNAGLEGQEKVIKDAKKFFNEDFTDIVPISAKIAYEGIESNNKALIDESNIYHLQEHIKNIFISKADEIKNNAKEQGSRTLLNKIEILINNHRIKIDETKANYDKNKKYYEEQSKISKNNIKNELDRLFENYLEGVNSRVNIHIDSLAEGKGKEFIKHTIYNVEDLTNRIKSFMNLKENELKRLAEIWSKQAYVSEYKYINHIVKVDSVNININQYLNYIELGNIQIFTPSQEEDLFSFLGNMWGKIKFWMNKSNIKNKLNSTIKEQCENINSNLESQFNSIINKSIDKCESELEKSFEQLVIGSCKIESYKEEIDTFEEHIFEEESECGLFDILG